MSSAEIHREPFIHLVDLAPDRALIAWGAFYFERTERGRWEISTTSELPGRVGRRTCIGATAEPFGQATVQVLTTRRKGCGRGLHRRTRVGVGGGSRARD